ncbi:MAG: hypothetical protein ABW195_00165 [Ilumatobacteraceae bacterium]
MVGVVLIVVVLLLVPVMVIISGGVASLIIGQTMEHDADVRNEGSELLDLDD